VTVLVVGAVVEISARKTQRVGEAKEAQKVGEVREAQKHTDSP
jgi:hypothetical protein